MKMQESIADTISESFAGRRSFEVFLFHPTLLLIHRLPPMVRVALSSTTKRVGLLLLAAWTLTCAMALTGGKGAGGRKIVFEEVRKSADFNEPDGIADPRATSMNGTRMRLVAKQNQPGELSFESHGSARVIPAPSLGVTDFGRALAIAPHAAHAYVGAKSAVFELDFADPRDPHIARAFTNESAGAEDFGCAVAATDTLLATGARGATVDQRAEAGVVYLTDLVGGAAPRSLHGTPSFGAHFGAVLAVDGDTLFVSAPDEHVADSVSTGVVYVFSLVDGALLRRITKPHSKQEIHFGRALAVDHESHVLLVSGYVPGGHVGVVHSFDIASPRAIITGPDLVAYDGADDISEFGRALAMAHGRAVVWDPKDDEGHMHEAGVAFEFHMGEHAHEGALTLWNKMKTLLLFAAFLSIAVYSASRPR